MALVVSLAVAAALGVAIAFLVRDVLVAKDSLEKAQATVSELRASVASSRDRLPALTDRLVSETGAARAATEGPVWRAAEALPWAGVNFAVVRQLATAVDDIAAGAVSPMIAAGGGDIEAKLKPVDGRIDVAAITQLVRALGEASAVVTDVSGRVQELDSSSTVDQVAAAHSQLAGMLSDAAEQLSAAANATSILPTMLGANGPRNYLLMFQNPAEARSLGGNPASMLLLNVDSGAVNIAAQASSGDFPGGRKSPIAVDPGLLQVYYERFPQFVMDIGTRPDFPTMATLGKAYWEQQFGGTIDGVVSFDPVALGTLLEATGPVVLPTGDELTSQNAVSLLLYEAYVRYKDPSDQDAFFASAAKAVFDAVVGGAADPAKLVAALTAAADQRRLMIWSPVAEEESVFSTLGVDGVLPTDNKESTTVGVFFNDHSSSKIDYFVDTAVRVTAECLPDGTRIYNVTYTVSSRLQPDQVKGLPDYITSDAWLDKGDFRTDAYVMGPVGSTFLDWRIDDPSDEDGLISSGTDLGRPVVRLSSTMGPADASTFTARFSAPAGDYGPLEVRTTPMVNATDVGITDTSCG